MQIMENSRITPYPLRMSNDLRKKLQASAEANGTSLNEEINSRLREAMNSPALLERIFKELDELHQKVDRIHQKLDKWNLNTYKTAAPTPLGIYFNPLFLLRFLFFLRI